MSNAKPSPRIKAVSHKRKKELRQYAVLRKQLLAERPICECWLAENGWKKTPDSFIYFKAIQILPCGHILYRSAYDLLSSGAPRSTQCHHTKGRGKYLLDYSTFMAVSDYWHKWIEDHKYQAIAKGWLSPDKNRRQLALPEPASHRIKCH